MYDYVFLKNCLNIVIHFFSSNSVNKYFFALHGI